MKKEFTENDMVEFASWFSNEITLANVNDYRKYVVKTQQKEFQLYLELKKKYEGKEPNPNLSGFRG